MAGAGNAEFRQMIEQDYNNGIKLYGEYLKEIFARNTNRAFIYRKMLLDHIDKYPIVFPMEDGASPFVPIAEEPAPMVRGYREQDAPLGRWENAPSPIVPPVRPVAQPAALQPTLLSMWGQGRGGRRKNKNRTRRRK